jgi:hypothetical protein
MTEDYDHPFHTLCAERPDHAFDERQPAQAKQELRATGGQRAQSPRTPGGEHDRCPRRMSRDGQRRRRPLCFVHRLIVGQTTQRWSPSNGERETPWEAERDGSGERLRSALDAGGLGLLDVLPTSCSGSYSRSARGCSKTTWLACSAAGTPAFMHTSDGQELVA